MKLLHKLNEIRKVIKVDKEFNKGQGYSAFTIAKLNAELNPLLIKHGIGIICNVKDQKVEQVIKETQYGPKINFLVTGTAEYTLIDCATDERETTSIPFIGMNQAGDPSKSLGNAASYAYKYLWITLLGLTDATSDVDSSDYDGTDTTPTSPLEGGLEEQVRESGGAFKDKGESKRIYAEYEDAFDKAVDGEVINGLIVSAREDFSNMLTYEQGKMKKLIAKVKEENQIT